MSVELYDLQIMGMNLKGAIVDGVRMLNTTPHEINFQDESGAVVAVPPCGFKLDATPIETVVGSGKSGVQLVKTVFQQQDNANRFLNLLDMLTAEYQTVIIGSLIAAQAYPGRVYMMTPTPGFERVPVAEKRMNPKKYTVFG
jgi:hypothetical protein